MSDPREIENHLVIDAADEYEKGDALLEQPERDPDADHDMDLLLDDDGCAFFEDQAEI